MRRVVVLACVGIVVAASAFGGGARAQQDAASAADVEIHRVRGRLAWQRAVWRLRPDEWTRPAAELEIAGKADAAAGKREFWTQFMLGTCRLRLATVGATRDLDAADIALSIARSMEPKYPGLALADALRETLLPDAPGDPPKVRVEAACAKFDAFFRDFAHPEDTPYATELLFLGRYFRGFSRARLPDRLDDAVEDLKEAAKLADHAGHAPPPDVVSLLAQVYKALNQMADAKRVVAEALQRDPAEATHYYNFGQLLLAEKDLTGARAWFDAALLRRPDAPETHLALADIARKLLDPGAMRRHLEAAAGLYEMRARLQNPVAPRLQADLDCGFGIYWKLVGDKRGESSDDAGMREAFEKAKAHFLAATAIAPGCFNAVAFLIQIESRIGGSETEIDDLKRRLEKLQNPGEGDPELFHSTFC